MHTTLWYLHLIFAIQFNFRNRSCHHHTSLEPAADHNLENIRFLSEQYESHHTASHLILQISRCAGRQFKSDGDRRRVAIQHAQDDPLNTADLKAREIFGIQWYVFSCARITIAAVVTDTVHLSPKLRVLLEHQLSIQGSIWTARNYRPPNLTNV